MLKDGCYVGYLHDVRGGCRYADDIVLLAPTVRAMRRLLSVCDDFASKYDVVFNASKSKCLVFKTTVGRRLHNYGTFTFYKFLYWRESDRICG